MFEVLGNYYNLSVTHFIHVLKYSTVSRNTYN